MGGIESHLRDLCTQLQHYVDLSVIVANDGGRATDDVVDGVQVHRASTRLTLASTSICPGMIGKLRNTKADVVHIHWPNPMAVLAYLTSGHRGKLVVTYHSDIVRQKRMGQVFEPFLHAALRHSSAIIATSPNYLESSEVLLRYRDRCQVIPFGIPLEEFENADASEIAGIRARYGERLILSVGRLVYYKGFEYLIHAMTKVRGKLLIIGDGPLKSKLHELVASLGLNDKVYFMGRVPGHIAAFYHAADIFTLASIARAEAFGIVQIEAMAAGIPVVNTQLESGVPFVSLHEKTGLTVPPADADALAAALNALLDNETLRREFGAAATIRAREEFSLPTMVSRTLDLYNRVAQPTESL
jgi:rhamnosyl/mannosyltransferase